MEKFLPGGLTNIICAKKGKIFDLLYSAEMLWSKTMTLMLVRYIRKYYKIEYLNRDEHRHCKPKFRQ